MAKPVNYDDLMNNLFGRINNGQLDSYRESVKGLATTIDAFTSKWPVADSTTSTQSAADQQNGQDDPLLHGGD